jgi:glycosyltransferase involved in cell wall biosynthesis
MKPRIVYIAQPVITEESGMGRVAWHWKREFERRGYEFMHIGKEQTGRLPHPGLFPYAAYRAYKRIGRRPALLMIHEPAAGAFTQTDIPTIVFSHGLERRGWQLALQGRDGTNGEIRFRTKLLFPFWRLRQCDVGLRKATRLLLINNEDADFAAEYYGRDETGVRVFKNGVYESTLSETDQPVEQTILFIGSWLERKGVRTLIDAAHRIHKAGERPRWLLAGTGAGKEDVLREWPNYLHPFIEVVPSFTRESEKALFARASLFVLPSFFEGQPLSLLQAMETGRCCITTNCCGQRDLIQDGVNGFLHEPGDAQKLASLVISALGNNELRLTLGKHAKRSVAGRRWDTVSSEIVDFIEEAMKKPGSNGDG